MKKSQKAVIAVLTAAITAGSAFALTACKKNLNDEPLDTSVKIADYTKTAADRAETFASGSKGNSWENGEPFNVWWEPDNVSYDGGKLSLSLSEMTEKESSWDEEKGENVPCVAEYYGAEERSEHYYGFGDFSVRMKPAKIAGTASTFFTCTGPYDVWYEGDPEKERANDHDEIDIEFLGKDTTKVQFNYFASGVGGHEYMYDLGFDASEAFHEYGFRWAEDHITWFVDNVPVYKVERKDIKEGEEWPEDPGRIIMNYWCGTQKASAWMGAFENDYSGHAEYEWAAASSEQKPDPSSTKVKPVEPPQGEVDVPTEGWTDIATDGFTGWNDDYTVDHITDGFTMSHSDQKGAYAYTCSGMDLTSSYSWVKFHIKNNKNVAAEVVMDVKQKSPSAGGVEATNPANEKVSVVSADSRARILLDANEELDVALKIKNIAVNQFIIFLNSTSAAADNAAEGSISITALKGIVNGEAPVPPTPTESLVKIGTNEVSFTGDGYTVAASEDKSSMTVSYEGVGGHSYLNILAGISDFVGDNNVFAVTIKNNGSETAKIRLDIGCNTADGSTQNDGKTKNPFCNISATYTGNTVASGNDYLYGGADWVQIAAGETVTAKITFTANVAKDIKFYMDSSTYNDEGKHTGEIVFSAMSLSKAGTVTPPQGGDPSDRPSVGEGNLTDIPSQGWINGSLDKFDGWDRYDIERFTEGLSDTMRIVQGKVIEDGGCCGMVLDYRYTWVKFTVKNNIGTAAELRIEFSKSGQSNSSAVLGINSTGSVTYDEEARIAVIALAGNQKQDIVIKLDPAADIDQMVFFINSFGDNKAETGNISVSNFKVIPNEADEAAPAPVEAPTEGWTPIDTSGFGGWDMYDVDTKDGVVISHSTAKEDFNCCGMDLVKNYSWIKFTVKNNGTDVARLRIDVKKNEKDVKKGAVLAVIPESVGSVLTSEQSAVLIIPAGATVNVAIKLKAEYFDQMVVFFDSVGERASSGSIKITDMQGIIDENIEHVEIGKAEKVNLAWVRSNGDYNVTPESSATNSVTVTYNNINYGSFSYIRAEIESVASKYNTVSFKVRNNGSQEMQLRIGITKWEKYYDGSRENINVCNVSITPDQTTYTDGRGGSYVAVGSGQEKTFTLKYDPTQGPKQLIIYLDSCKKDGNEQRSGNATIGEFTFSNT